MFQASGLWVYLAVWGSLENNAIVLNHSSTKHYTHLPDYNTDHNTYLDDWQPTLIEKLFILLKDFLFYNVVLILFTLRLVA